ncbi:MAG TPA: hypothetical protein DEG06_08625, partial [Lachnospiraceae bacterium]|nr:hypothetical protein [Lachnospiraceae bacterium]
DPLIGLKENVIIGKLIPAGTGMKRYRSIKLDSDLHEEAPKGIEGEYNDEFDTFDYSEEGSHGEEHHEPEDGVAEVVYNEEKYGKDGDLQREESIPGVDDASVSMGENTHNDGDYTETEFNLKGIVEDDYSDGL